MKKDQALYRIASFVLPLSVGVILIFLAQTQVIHKIFGFTTAQLPLPALIIKQLIINHKKIFIDLCCTLKSTLIGLTLGSLLGFIAAALASVKPKVFKGLLPLLVALNSVSVVAMAPIMNRWFNTSFGAKTAVITIACIGAMAVNAYKGMNDLPNYSLNLMKTYAASTSEVFFKLRLPNSVSRIFIGLKTNVVTAMISAIISEFFATETLGLGYMIKRSLKIGNKKVLGWAYILVAAAISIVIYLIISFIERRVTKWRKE